MKTNLPIDKVYEALNEVCRPYMTDTKAFDVWREERRRNMFVTLQIPVSYGDAKVLVAFRSVREDPDAISIEVVYHPTRTRTPKEATDYACLTLAVATFVDHVKQVEEAS